MYQQVICMCMLRHRLIWLDACTEPLHALYCHSAEATTRTYRTHTQTAISEYRQHLRSRAPVHWSCQRDTFSFLVTTLTLPHGAKMVRTLDVARKQVKRSHMCR